MRKSTAKVAFLLSIFLAAGLFAFPVNAAPEGPLAEKRLENVHLKATNIAQVLADLAFCYDIPVGLETANVAEPEETYRLDFERITLKELLDRVVADYDEYAWKIQDGVVNVFPKESSRDALIAEILSTEIDKFTIKEHTSCWSFTKTLFSTSELTSVLGGTNFDGYLGGFYIQQLGRKFSAEFTRTTTVSILNQVVKDSPVARIWMLGTYRSNGTIYLTVSSRFENQEPVAPGFTQPTCFSGLGFMQ